MLRGFFRVLRGSSGFSVWVFRISASTRTGCVEPEHCKAEWNLGELIGTQQNQVEPSRPRPTQQLRVSAPIANGKELGHPLTQEVRGVRAQRAAGENGGQAVVDNRGHARRRPEAGPGDSRTEERKSGGATDIN